MNFLSKVGEKLRSFFGNTFSVDNRRLKANVSAYPPLSKHTDENPNETASGGKPGPNVVAATSEFSLGDNVYIPQLKKEAVVGDRFGPRIRAEAKVKGETRIDVYKPTEQEAVDFGRKQLTAFRGTRSEYDQYQKDQIKEINKPFSMVGETLKQFFNLENFKEASKQKDELPVFKQIKQVFDFIKPKNEEEARKMLLINIGSKDSPLYVDPTGFVGELKPVQQILGGLSKKALTKVAESIDPGEIFKIIKSGMKGLSDEVLKPIAERLTKTKTVEEVTTTLKNIADDGLDLLTKERGFVDTVKTAPKTVPEVAEGVKGRYVPITNKATLDEANHLIATNLDEAIRIVKSSEAATARSNTIAQRLIDEFQNAGRYQDAIDIVEVTAKKATSQGQAIQALSMYNRLTPEGVLKYTQRLVDQSNLARFKTPELVEKAIEKGKAIVLKPTTAKEIVEQSKFAKTLPEGSRESIVETAKLLKKITDQIPSTLLEKVSFIQTIGQLLNFKTATRNIIGNAGFAAIENVKDVLAVAIDSPLSFFTGKKTKAFPSFLAQFKGGKKGLMEGVQDALTGIDTNFIPSQFDLPKTGVFKGKVGQSLEKLLNLELRAPDKAFYKAAYDGSLYQQMKAAGVKVATDAMKEIAHYDALYRTFQDDSVVARMFMGLKKALNLRKKFGVGDILIKYPKTPGNLLARGIDYSPVGFVNSVFEMVKPLIGQEFNQRAFVESFSRAITGTTTLIGTGALLHKVGIITGKKDPDADVRGIQRTVGLGQYKINISGLKRFVMSGFDPDLAQLQEDDTLLSYDWFQPQAIGISIGANIDEGDGIVGSVAKVIEYLGEGINTLAEQPLISGLTKVTRASTFFDIISNVLEGVPSSFIPTILSQINQLIDNTQRSSYSPTSLGYATNLAKAKIPGVAQTLPPAVSVLGEDLERYQGESNNLFNVFFNPAFVSSFKPTPEAQLVLDLMAETGEKTQFPRSVSYTQTINGEKIKISPTQVNALQHYVGTITKELFHSFAVDETFQSLPAEDKVKYLQNVLTDVGAAGRIIILGNRPDKISKRVQQILERYNQ